MNEEKNTKPKSDKDIEYEKKLRNYIFQALFMEISKIVIFLIIAIYLNLVTEYLVALLILMLLRHNGGGLHFKHYFSCLIVSFIFVYSSIFLGLYAQPSRLFLMLSVLICILPGYYLVPITSTNRPAATETQIKKSKKYTTYILLLFFCTVCYAPLNKYIYIGYWTTILHIFQLIIARVKGGKRDA